MAQWVQLRGRVPEEEIAKRAGAKALRSELAVELGEADVDVYMPNGQPLVKLRRRAISAELCEQALPGLRLAAQKYSSNLRSRYGGGAYGPRRKDDGSYTTNSYSIDPVTHEALMTESAVAGYFDRVGGRWPFCRTTAFTDQHVREWTDILPMIARVDQMYQQASPEHYQRQRDMVDKCSADFVIRGTAFTTLTINRNVAGTIHKDAGDFKGGMGVISCVRRGQYTGGILCFPQYKVGVDLRDGDMVLFNPHEWHAVTDFETKSEDFERLTIVYYARTRIAQCGSAAEELERAKRFREGSALDEEPKPE